MWMIFFSRAGLLAFRFILHSLRVPIHNHTPKSTIMVKILTGVVILMSSTFVLPAPTGIQTSPKATSSVDRSQAAQRLASAERCPIHPPAGTNKNSEKVHKRPSGRPPKNFRLDGWQLIEPVPSDEGYQLDYQHLMAEPNGELQERAVRIKTDTEVNSGFKFENLHPKIQEQVNQRIEEWEKKPDGIEERARLLFWFDMVLIRGSLGKVHGRRSKVNYAASKENCLYKDWSLLQALFNEYNFEGKNSKKGTDLDKSRVPQWENREAFAQQRKVWDIRYPSSEGDESNAGPGNSEGWSDGSWCFGIGDSSFKGEGLNDWVEIDNGQPKTNGPSKGVRKTWRYW
ncbi:hypothetical protein FB446DRAFT_719897 [Lentinula raphanica]|nr:hypothetical protein FB446DRAFT_719897 [Lentinula raphanica]